MLLSLFPASSAYALHAACTCARAGMHMQHACLASVDSIVALRSEGLVQLRRSGGSGRQVKGAIPWLRGGRRRAARLGQREGGPHGTATRVCWPCTDSDSVSRQVLNKIPLLHSVVDRAISGPELGRSGTMSGLALGRSGTALAPPRNRAPVPTTAAAPAAPAADVVLPA